MKDAVVFPMFKSSDGTKTYNLFFFLIYKYIIVIWGAPKKSFLIHYETWLIINVRYCEHVQVHTNLFSPDCNQLSCSNAAHKILRQ